MKKLVLVLMSCMLAFGCTDPDDMAPVLEVFNLSPAPSTALVCGDTEGNVITLNSSDTLEVTFRLTDNDALSQFKIDLHNNFDCHGHSGKVETTDWFVIDIEDVSGNDETITRQIPVPVDVTVGNYHFSLQATDVAGNSAETAILSLNVTNASDALAPVLSLSAPASQNLSVQKGTVINFQGSLTDNNPLGDGTNGRIEVAFWQAGQTESDLYDEQFEASIGENYNFNFDAIVPITTVDGTYTFEVRAYDAVNNPSNSFQYTVEVF